MPYRAPSELSALPTGCTLDDFARAIGMWVAGGLGLGCALALVGAGLVLEWPRVLVYRLMALQPTAMTDNVILQGSALGFDGLLQHGWGGGNVLGDALARRRHAPSSLHRGKELRGQWPCPRSSKP